MSSQTRLFLTIVLIAVFAFIIGILITPNAVGPAIALAKGAGNSFVFLIIAVIMFLAPGVIGFAGRSLIGNMDNRVERDEDIPAWGHWLIAILLGVAIGFIWASFVPFLVNLPTWVKALYITLGWLKDIGVPYLSWGIYALITFMIGYGLPKFLEDWWS